MFQRVFIQSKSHSCAPMVLKKLSASPIFKVVKLFTVLYSLLWKSELIAIGYSLKIIGRCKSSFHQFLHRVMENVEANLKLRGECPKQIFLPHCTWDKFGDILANSGGRSMGLFDEIVSFFATMNMYSSNKMQVSDTKEYQDFLQMHTGKTKSRETGTAVYHPYYFCQYYYFFLLEFTH